MMLDQLVLIGSEAGVFEYDFLGNRYHADIVVQMLQTPAGGSSNACIQIGGRLAKHVMLVPQEYYVNVHNAEFPNGAVRGQLLK